MTRDYARSNRARSKGKNTRVAPSRKTTPGWVWFIAGILVGTLATAVLLPSPAEGPIPGSQPQVATVEREPSDETSPAHKPRFDFYTLLKETEVIVPEEEGAGNGSPAASQVKEITSKEQQAKTEEKQQEDSSQAATAAESDSPTAADTKPPKPTESSGENYQTVYVLQAGSFKNAADADSVRARLLLLNLQASIEKVTTGNNETWHRVLIGPFADKSASGKARAILTQNGIDSIQLKRRL